MLQQTQVDKVLPYFARFMASFPTLTDLANAPLDKVLQHWAGLGYYSRARNLHKAAGLVLHKHGGHIPDDAQALRNLPGIGAYTAGAILSIAFDQPVHLVDGNVERVLARCLALKGDLRKGAHKLSLIGAAKALVKGARPGDLNQSLMELGALLCRPGQPDCAPCPLASTCQAKALNLQQTLPTPRQRSIQKPLRMALAIISQDDKLLLVQRPEQGLYGGLWELPGIEVASSASRATIKSGLQKMLAVPIKMGRRQAQTKRLLTHRRLQLDAYPVSLDAPLPTQELKLRSPFTAPEVCDVKSNNADPVAAQRSRAWEWGPDAALPCWDEGRRVLVNGHKLRFLTRQELADQALSSAMKELLQKLKLL